MFGRHHDKGAPQEAEAQVEVHLEWDIEAVRRAVIAFLQSPGDGSRRSLLAALERLDNQIDLGDTYARSIVDPSLFGQAPEGAVVGETSSHSTAQEVPGAVLRAQVTLVRAAKDAIRDLNPGTLGDLRTASASLASVTGDADSA
jgi:hypothetical protein